MIWLRSAGFGLVDYMDIPTVSINSYTGKMARVFGGYWINIRYTVKVVPCLHVGC